MAHLDNRVIERVILATFGAEFEESKMAGRARSTARKTNTPCWKQMLYFGVNTIAVSFIEALQKRPHFFEGDDFDQRYYEILVKSANRRKTVVVSIVSFIISTPSQKIYTNVEALQNTVDIVKSGSEPFFQTNDIPKINATRRAQDRAEEQARRDREQGQQAQQPAPAHPLQQGPPAQPEQPDDQDQREQSDGSLFIPQYSRYHATPPSSPRVTRSGASIRHPTPDHPQPRAIKLSHSPTPGPWKRPAPPPVQEPPRKKSRQDQPEVTTSGLEPGKNMDLKTVQFVLRQLAATRPSKFSILDSVDIKDWKFQLHREDKLNTLMIVRLHKSHLVVAVVCPRIKEVTFMDPAVPSMEGDLPLDFMPVDYEPLKRLDKTFKEVLGPEFGIIGLVDWKSNVQACPKAASATDQTIALLVRVGYLIDDCERPIENDFFLWRRLLAAFSQAKVGSAPLLELRKSDSWRLEAADLDEAKIMSGSCNEATSLFTRLLAHLRSGRFDVKNKLDEDRKARGVYRNLISPAAKKLLGQSPSPEAPDYSRALQDAEKSVAEKKAWLKAMDDAEKCLELALDEAREWQHEIKAALLGVQ